MNRYTTTAILSLLIFVMALPLYALRERQRLAQAQDTLQEQVLVEAAVIYVENCATCHGPVGEGIGVTPALNNPALTEASPDALFHVIARAAHGSTMAAWHINEGGILNDYQIRELVMLIQANEWQAVAEAAGEQDNLVASLLSEELVEVYMQTEDETDPHACKACHEEPEVHLGQFGLNCGRCHSPEAWTPALLVRHNFPLEHGGEEPASCQTCHIENYVTNNCYQCHDHDPQEMVTIHLDYDIVDLTFCVSCHPTGAPGEAEKLLNGADERVEAIPVLPQLLAAP